MINWKNLDTLASFEKLASCEKVNLVSAMSGEEGARRVKKYTVPMGAGMDFNYGARAVNDEILEKMKALAEEAQLADKFEALYNGEVINTGEKRLVMHHMTRGQLGQDVVVDGVNKREFYLEQQKKFTDLANKIHAGEITNAAGESSTPLFRSASAAATWAPEPCILPLKTGRR